ncbi:MAG TPA: hypothetical protein VMF69_25115, partial [Gemmataceae bacterium]|nr:hypothetical protein [Gemmataceae bacterium]
DELGDWQGGFLALTGLTRNEEPEMVGVLRTGKSRMLPLALRMVLLESGPIHCIARVEGVPIFQIGDAQKRPQPEIAKRLCAPAIQLAAALHSPRKPSLYQIALLENAAGEEAEEMPDSGFFLSLLPDAVAFGTAPDVLSDAIRRYKGKSAAPSLAPAPAFRAAAEIRSRPGLFAWSDPPRLTRLINDSWRRDLSRRQDAIRRRPLAKGEKRDAAKLREELRQAEIEHRREMQEWTFLQKAANLAGMHYFATGLSLHKGEFAFRFEARMREKQISPLLDLLANQKLSPTLLQGVPGDAFCLFAVPLPDGAATLARVLKLADAYVAASGEESPLPSKTVAELEKQMKLRLGRDVLGKIRSAAVAVHLVDDKEAINSYPVFVLEAASETAAKDLMAVYPSLFSAGDKRIEPRQHKINGQPIRSLTDKPADADLSGPPPHYGCRGKIVVFGWHRNCVAATLRGSSRKKDLLNLPRGLATVDAEGSVGALGLFSCRQLLAHLTQFVSTMPDQDAAHRRILNYLREASTPMAVMPPTVFSIKRFADGVRMEFRQSELPVASATVVDIALTQMLDAEAESIGWLGLLFGRPQPPPPPLQFIVPAPVIPPAPPAAPPVPPPPPPAPAPKG